MHKSVEKRKKLLTFRCLGKINANSKEISYIKLLTSINDNEILNWIQSYGLI